MRCMTSSTLVARAGLFVYIHRPPALQPCGGSRSSSLGFASAVFDGGVWPGVANGFELLCGRTFEVLGGEYRIA